LHPNLMRSKSDWLIVNIPAFVLITDQQLALPPGSEPPDN